MYFTRYSKKDKKEKIFFAKYISESNKKSGWLSENSPMEFCTGNSTYAYPAISSDGDFLIFASDKQGSLGGMDLFITRKEGDKWIAAENLGKYINTTGNEIFPFLDTDNNLFFSSDGLTGYGGYDLFTCKFNGIGWDKPMNLSRRINSELDEIAFTIDKKDGKRAFYTRRQNYGNRRMQLFMITLNKEAADSNLSTISKIFNGKPVVGTSSTTIKDTSKVRSPAEMTIKQEPSIEKTNIKPNTSKTDDLKDTVIYRVQIISSPLPQKGNEIILNGVTYKMHQYFYQGEYRYTIGEFRSVVPATELMNNCRRSGYPQAFVVEFKNNTRSLNPKLLK
jgi:hypothetical protein